MCKLIAPLFIALIDGFSTELAIIVNFAMNVASVVMEYFAIARVCPASRFHDYCLRIDFSVIRFITKFQHCNSQRQVSEKKLILRYHNTNLAWPTTGNASKQWYQQVLEISATISNTQHSCPLLPSPCSISPSYHFLGRWSHIYFPQGTAHCTLVSLEPSQLSLRSWRLGLRLGSWARSDLFDPVCGRSSGRCSPWEPEW